MVMSEEDLRRERDRIAALWMELSLAQLKLSVWQRRCAWGWFAQAACWAVFTVANLVKIFG